MLFHCHRSVTYYARGTWSWSPLQATCHLLSVLYALQPGSKWHSRTCLAGGSFQVHSKPVWPREAIAGRERAPLLESHHKPGSKVEDERLWHSEIAHYSSINQVLKQYLVQDAEWPTYKMQRADLDFRIGRLLPFDDLDKPQTHLPWLLAKEAYFLLWLIHVDFQLFCTRVKGHIISCSSLVVQKTEWSGPWEWRSLLSLQTQCSFVMASPSTLLRCGGGCTTYDIICTWSQKSCSWKMPLHTESAWV